jgi:hypothetical protein
MRIVMRFDYFDDLESKWKWIEIYYDDSYVSPDIFYSFMIMMILIRAKWVIYISMHNFINCDDIKILFYICIAPPYARYFSMVFTHIFVCGLHFLEM